MTDKLGPLNMHGHASTWQEELLEVTRERDELRAEVERQTEELNDLDTKLGSALRAIGLEHAEVATWRATAVQTDKLRYEAANALNASLAEVERLKREVDYWMNLDAAALERENERLRARLEAQDQVVEASRRLMTPGAKFGSHYRVIAQALGMLDGTWPKP